MGTDVNLMKIKVKISPDYRPQFNQNKDQQPFGYRLQQPMYSTDACMTTAPPGKTQGFRLNQHVVEQQDPEDSSLSIYL